jgi:deoxyribodipyrimidine photo-lyase
LVNKKRIRVLKEGPHTPGPVLYWMQRDQRVEDNWALFYARELAEKNNTNLLVVFCLVPLFEEATIRQYDFMIKGLMEVENSLRQKNISFHVLSGNPPQNIKNFIDENSISKLVTDFNPLKVVTRWKEEITKNIIIPFHEVDAHNIVPCWIASDKAEYAAYTIRPKINKYLDEYLEEFPLLKPQKCKMDFPVNNWERLRNLLQVNKEVKEIEWLEPGESTAITMLEKFINERFENYHNERNDPVLNRVSHLSPYLHFGQLSPQRAALAILPLIQYPESQSAFLEELIIRRELSDNYCFYNKNYDSLEGIHPWAKETLQIHKNDKREYIYTEDVLENAKTHDDLWNAAQLEMVSLGKMHGYMRMYWAKKILEWTKNPEEAFRIAVYLNNKYELDGRDPNGYAGIAWSIGGLHDRAWTERPVFGKIRYMNYNGCKRKFDVNAYIRKYLIPLQSELNF